MSIHDPIRTVSLAGNADFLAMMAYLRDLPQHSLGVHVAGRPDINGARLQAGIRYLFNRTAPAATPAPLATPNGVPTNGPLGLRPAQMPVPAAPAPARARKPAAAKDGAPGTVKALLSVLARVSKAAEPKHSIPMLGCVRITISAGVATIQCTDLELAYTETLAMPDAPDMDIVTPVKTLIAALRAMDGAARVTISATEGQGGKNDFGFVRIGQTAFNRLATADFPICKPGPFSHSFAIDSAAFLSALAPVMSAVSTEETRYYLNGVFMCERAGELRLVATDGHRLAKHTLPLPDGAAGLPDIIVPRLMLRDVLALLAKATGEVRFRVSSTRIELTIGSTVLLSKSVDGTFPEYERVIPRDNPKLATLDRADLIAACKAAKAIGGNNCSTPVRLDIESGICTARAFNPEGLSTANRVAIIGAAPEDFSIGYQARYVLNILDQTSGDIHFAWGDAGAPAVITDTANPDLLFVLMPMRL